ncbi:MAG: glycosyltransferase family 9 protein [Deltaproteobacteria bacterium]|nr:glycosyltransferase family 9 protein [Deltaproteobacteria bacterium]
MIKKIVIFRLDGLGDVVLSTAALREVRNGFPDARITLVVSPWSAGILKHSKLFDELVVYDTILFNAFRGKRAFNFKKELNVIKYLRKQGFDLGIDLRGDFLSILPMYLSRCRYRFARPNRSGGFLLTNRVYWDKKTRHEFDKNRLTVEALGIIPKNPWLEINLSGGEESKVNKFIEINNLQGKPIAIIAPCALYKWKEWRPERFAELGVKIMEKFNAGIVLVGASEHKETLENINTMADNKFINCAGIFNLLELAALIERSNLFIGNDSGLNHIAATFKTPLIQLFGPGVPEVFGHFYKKSIIIQKTDCQYHPCIETACKNKENWCMDRIRVADVMEAVGRLLRKL